MKEPAATQVQAFTIKYNGLVHRITTLVELSQPFDPALQPDPGLPHHKTQALWDTGATNSLITKATVDALGLVPVGTTMVSHAGGTGQSSTYLVNLYLPNKVCVSGVLVTECPDTVGQFGAIIGMDVITLGDLAITNVQKTTRMSFFTPSSHVVDYVAEINATKYAGVGRNAPCPCGNKDANGKPVKFKHCHGKPGA